jgi:hypothetical protein
MNDIKQIILMMGILGLLMLILFLRVTTFCETVVVEEMNGTIINLKTQLLKDPITVVKLENGETVELKESEICAVGTNIHVQRVEGNCRGGWYNAGGC